jgi:nicotinamidase-related amidase
MVNLEPAILIIDMLEDFFKEGRLREHRAELVGCMNNLIDWARENKLPLIWVRQEFEPDLSDAFPIMRKNNMRITIKGTGGEEVLSELHRETSDYEIIKKRYSPFFKTTLENLLRELDIDTLIIAGINTHACIRTAAIDAYQRDYEVIIAKEAVDSYDPEHHEITLDYLSKGIAAVLFVEEIKSIATSTQ